jgi:hypothetical protein
VDRSGTAAQVRSQDSRQFGRGNGLLQVINGAKLHGIHITGYRVPTRQNQDRQVPIYLHCPLQEHAPFKLRSALAHDYELPVFSFDSEDSFLKRSARRDGVAQIFQELTGVLATRWFGVNKQNSRRGSGFGPVICLRLANSREIHSFLHIRRMFTIRQFGGAPMACNLRSEVQ